MDNGKKEVAKFVNSGEKGGMQIMKLSKKLIDALIKEKIPIKEIEELDMNAFIKRFNNSNNITLRTASQKMAQYYNNDVKRELLVDIMKDGKMTTNKRKYNKAVYKTFCIMNGIIEKYSNDGDFFFIPIEYLSNCAETSQRTAKKAINTALKYKIIKFLGYDKTHSDFAMCKFKLLNKSLLEQWIDYGKEWYGEFEKSYVKKQMKDNIKSMNLNDEKKIKDSLKAMKNCPYLIKAFNESNRFGGEFKQTFLLDGKLRASSKFTLTKNPDNHPDSDVNLFERHRLLLKLQTINGCSEYAEYDINASIYTLSYYLKYNEFPKGDFYDLFALKLKQIYHQDKEFKSLRINKDLRKNIKLFCMRIYMHGYNPIGRGAYIGVCKKLLLEGKQLYNTHIINEIEYVDDLYKYFTGNTVDNAPDISKAYQTFFKYAFQIMKELCDIKRSKIFLYESLLCSLLISMGIKDGVQIVNAYDGFYMPSDYIDTFKKRLLPSAYKQVRNIYQTYNSKSVREKNTELLDYLIEIGRVYEYNNRTYIKIKDVYVDFYNYELLRKDDFV